MQHHSADLRVDHNLPDRLKIAIADAVVIYSSIESLCVEIVWEIEKADLERKKEIANAWADQNFKRLKRTLKLIPGANTYNIWPTLKKLTKERNLIAHGEWSWTNADRAFVVWHAKFYEEEDWIGGEFYDWHRFNAYMKRANWLRDTFLKLRVQPFGWVDELIEKGLLPKPGEPEKWTIWNGFLSLCIRTLKRFAAMLERMASDS